MLGVGIVTMRTAKANERQGNGHKPA